MNKYFAELIGTAVLCFIGCGAIAIGGLGGALGVVGTGPLALLPIALAFGLSVTAMAYAIGPVSGCHINPAVSVGAFVAGRLSFGDLIGYIIAQIIGAFVGCGLLALLLSGKVGGYDYAVAGLGQTDWDPTKWSTLSAFLAEAIGTFSFLIVILGSTQSKTSTIAAGLVIGLTLAILHLVNVPISGNSLNPARSLVPAVFVGGHALAGIWLYVVAPVVGAIVAGLVFRLNLLYSEQ